MSNSNTALILSIGLHVTVATIAYVGLPSLLKEPPTPIPPISIEFVKVDKETRLSAPEKKLKEPEAAPQKTSQYAKAEAYEAPATEAVPTLDAAKAPKPKPRRKPEISDREKLVSSAKPRSRPKPPSRFKVKKLAALIDKSIKDDSEVAEKPKEDAKKEPEAKAERKLFGSFKNKIATASLIEAFKQKVITCWNLPSGGKDIQDMRVTVRVWLRKDGRLMRTPAFVGAGDLNASGREDFRAFAESARRAVKICEPYENLPKDRYDEWSVIDFNFDPSDMY